MPKRPPLASDRGFTLVEILIAIFIFAVVISSVYGSYRATFNVINGSEARLAVANSARVVVDRVVADLSSSVIGPGGEFHGEVREFGGYHADSLAFVSTAHLVLQKADLHSGYNRIEYLAEPDDDNSGLLNLYRSETELLPGPDSGENKAVKRLICRGLKEIRFAYLGRDGNKTDEWQVDTITDVTGQTSNPAELFPALVSIELRFSDAPGSENSTLFRTAAALP